MIQQITQSMATPPAGDGCKGAGSGLGKAEFFAWPFGGRVVVVRGGDCWAVEPGAASAAVTFCHG